MEIGEWPQADESKSLQVFAKRLQSVVGGFCMFLSSAILTQRTLKTDGIWIELILWQLKQDRNHKSLHCGLPTVFSRLLEDESNRNETQSQKECFICNIGISFWGLTWATLLPCFGLRLSPCWAMVLTIRPGGMLRAASFLQRISECFKEHFFLFFSFFKSKKTSQRSNTSFIIFFSSLLIPKAISAPKALPMDAFKLESHACGLHGKSSEQHSQGPSFVGWTALFQEVPT